MSSSSSSFLQELKDRVPQLKANPQKFEPSSVASWKNRTPESGRIATTDIACNLMQTVIYSTPGDLLPLMYLLAKKVCPAHGGLELDLIKYPQLILLNSFPNIVRISTHLLIVQSGKFSQRKKRTLIQALLVAATDCEPQYLIGLLLGKLRIGMAENTLLAALGQAAVYTEKHSTPPADIKSPVEEGS
ncbi:hypothetical protein PIB30_069506 [Stylosanthes scabra]|uniref:DNA ligase ATP-dependent N-terminal domain-containing protein n=1 Tax=Stylosanthes scabra TaxID=79078 RepID=A0ABU6WR83_9FABA|nr:hypothetical protein [Stylosanthes scabra]